MAGREVPLPADAGDHTPREDGARLVDQEGQPIYMGAVAMMNGMTMAERRRKDAKRELLKAKAGLAADGKLTKYEGFYRSKNPMIGREREGVHGVATPPRAWPRAPLVRRVRNPGSGAPPPLPSRLRRPPRRRHRRHRPLARPQRARGVRRSAAAGVPALDRPHRHPPSL